MAKRIIIETLNYAPDSIGIAKYSTELAEWLAERGWDVVVITAYPYYPGWQNSVKYAWLKYTRDHIRGVEVLRCPFYVPKKPTALSRILHLASFASSSAPAVAREALRFKPDIFLSVAPALFAAGACLAAAKLSRRPAVLHVQDFELDMAFSLGLLKGPRALKQLTRVEAGIYKSFDHVFAPSNAMTSKLVSKGCSTRAVDEFRNWTDLQEINPTVPGAALRHDIGIDPSKFVALYSGNLSEKQGIGILVDVARLLLDDTNIHLVICGEGPARSDIEQGVADLPNTTLLPLQSKERFPELLSVADVHLLPQLSGADNLVLPSKLAGMLSSGRPTIATVTGESDIAREIGPAGLCVAPGDPAAVADAIRSLSVDDAMRSAMGKEARHRAEAFWGKEKILEGFEQHLFDIIETRSAAG